MKTIGTVAIILLGLDRYYQIEHVSQAVAYSPSKPGKLRFPTALLWQEADDKSGRLRLIVTQALHWFAFMLMGSVAEGLARVASKPVLLVRSE